MLPFTRSRIQCTAVNNSINPDSLCTFAMQEVMEMCDEQAELFDWFGWTASRLGECCSTDSWGWQFQPSPGE